LLLELLSGGGVTMTRRNLKYTTVPIIMSVLLLIVGAFGIYYFIAFITVIQLPTRSLHLH